MITNSQVSIKDSWITLSLAPKNHPVFEASMVPVLFLSEYLAAGAAEAPQPMAVGTPPGAMKLKQVVKAGLR